MTICIFCDTGRTYTFRDAAILTDNETVIVFQYQAMSDGKKKVATFQKQRFVGHSVSES